MAQFRYFVSLNKHVRSSIEMLKAKFLPNCSRRPNVSVKIRIIKIKINSMHVPKTFHRSGSRAAKAADSSGKIKNFFCMTFHGRAETGKKYKSTQFMEEEIQLHSVPLCFPSLEEIFMGGGASDGRAIALIQRVSARARSNVNFLS